MPLLLTLHMPSLPVVQVAVPEAPLLHLPLTVTLASGLWFASCTVIVTLAVHKLPWMVLVASRSPMCIVVVPLGVDVRVAVGEGSAVGVAVGAGSDFCVRVGAGLSVGVSVGTESDVGVRVGVETVPLSTQLSLPESLNVCPAMGMNCQS